MNKLKQYYKIALKNHFALGAFNFNNMESLQGIVSGCKKTNAPAIIAVSEGALSYIGDDFIIELAKGAKASFPHLFLHLDHGKSFEVCKKAIDLGFDSVMIDGSSLEFDENIALTKKVCDYAHKFDVQVEGELGQLKGIEDNVSSSDHHFTDPNQAKIFVESTGVDSLAVAIGTSHGAYKYKGEQTLRFDILQEIENLLPSFPLVLHGASTVDKELVDKFNSFGGCLEHAVGVPKDLLIEAIKNHNIVKINTDTDLRLAMSMQVRKVLSENPKEFDLRKYLGKGREEIERVVMDKNQNLLFSANNIN